MIFKNDIGIDFGTSRTRIFLEGKGIVFNEPTALIKDSLGRTTHLGEAAYDLIGRSKKHHKFLVRPINRGVIDNQDYAAEYIRYALRKSKGLFNIFRSDATVSISADINNMEERVLINTCRNAGVRNVFTEKKVILSAFGTGMHGNEIRGRIVADIGAGTTEVGILSLGGIISENAIKFGGLDMDKSIINHIREKYLLEIGEYTAEKIKRKIGAASILPSPTSAKIQGSDVNTKLPKVIKINSNDVVDAIQDDLRKIVDIIAQVFESSPPEITTDIIESGIILTGGVSKLPGIAEVVDRHINTKVNLTVEPELSTIRGIGKLIKTHHMRYHKKVVS